jgi:hypothetical protein
MVGGGAPAAAEGNVVLLERLSPEVRELVPDIVRRVEPVRYEELRRLL